MSAELIGMILAVSFLCAMSAWIGWAWGITQSERYWIPRYGALKNYAIEEAAKSIEQAYFAGMEAAKHDQK